MQNISSNWFKSPTCVSNVLWWANLLLGKQHFRVKYFAFPKEWTKSWPSLKTYVRKPVLHAKQDRARTSARCMSSSTLNGFYLVPLRATQHMEKYPYTNSEYVNAVRNFFVLGQDQSLSIGIFSFWAKVSSHRFFFVLCQTILSGLEEETTIELFWSKSRKCSKKS